MDAQLARSLWGGETDAVGQLVRLEGVTRQVIGVVTTVRTGRSSSPSASQMYVPIQQLGAGAVGGVSVLVLPEAGVSEARLVAALEGIRTTASSTIFGPISSLSLPVEAALAPDRLRLTVVSLAGAFGLVLVVVAIAIAVTQAVQTARWEFAVRLALGAAPGRLVRDVISEGAVAILVGILFGAAFTRPILSLAGWLGAGEVRFSALAGLTAGGVVAVAGMLAVVLPARRIAALDPAAALKEPGAGLDPAGARAPVAVIHHDPCFLPIHWPVVPSHDIGPSLKCFR